MAENKPVVESIKIGTLDKQIEILEKLGLTKSEILEQTELITNLIYDTQGQITKENSDVLSSISNQLNSIAKIEDEKQINQLLGILLQNLTEVSVTSVLRNPLIGKVIKKGINSDNSGFDNAKSLLDIMNNAELYTELISHREVHKIVSATRYYMQCLKKTNNKNIWVNDQQAMYDSFQNPRNIDALWENKVLQLACDPIIKTITKETLNYDLTFVKHKVIVVGYSDLPQEDIQFRLQLTKPNTASPIQVRYYSQTSIELFDENAPAALRGIYETVRVIRDSGSVLRRYTSTIRVIEFPNAID